jgi:hypothetical protein
VTTADAAYPVTIRGELTSPPGQGWWLIKWLLAIPHYICLFFLGIAFFIVAIIAFFSILFTGKYPRELFKFNTGVIRWGWRVAFYAYGALATDKYPPFSLEPDPNYPADVTIPYPEKLSKGLVLVKWWLLAIPHYIIVSIIAGGWGWAGCWGDTSRVWDYKAGDNIVHVTNNSTGGPGLIFMLAIFAGVYLLFSGKYHKDIFKLVLGLNQWVVRVAAYSSLMTDEYPPFRIGDN